MNLATETDVRALRDAIYGESTENNWESCRENWIKTEEAAWLWAEYRKLTKTIDRPNDRITELTKP